DRGISSRHRGEIFRPQVTNGTHLRAARFRKVTNEIGAPIAVADDANVDHGNVRLLPCGKLPPSNSVHLPGFRTLAGTPATTAPGGTSCVTTAPAPIIAPSPMVTPQRIVAWEPIEARRWTCVRSSAQSDAPCNSPVAVVARGK